MTRLLLYLLAAVLATSALAQERSEMYIIPVDADGNVNFVSNDDNLGTDADYPDKIQLNANPDGTFSLESVAIEYGFYLLGNNAAAGTLYTLPGWAQTPPIEIGPNPLTITQHESKNYIAVASGTYDIAVQPRGIDGNRSNTFTIHTSGSDQYVYPAKIYLYKSPAANASDYVAVEGTDGVYTYNLTNPTGNIVISYEPRTDYPQFIYGPTKQDLANLGYGQKVALERNTNTSTPLTYALEGKSTPVKLTISLAGGNEYVMVGTPTPTGITTVETTPDSAAHYYTLTGVFAGSDPTLLAPGLYIRLSGNSATKVHL